MKTIKTLFLVAICSVLFISCEKKIDLNLEESEQLFVIEGIVHDSLGDNFVKLSKTRPFDNNGAIERISNATVQILDNTGATFNLYETATPGYYTDPTLRGISGRTYDLIVDIDGEVITATSHMNPRTEIDSLSYEELPSFDPNAAKEYGIYFYFTDSLNYENYYRVKTFLEGEQEDGFLNLSDDFIDGAATFFPVFEASYLAGDNPTVQMLSVDEVNFRYFSGLSLSQGGEVPANPETNLSGDKAVGYFGAYAKSEVTIIIVP